MLYLVSTPIGNLDDITFRAVKVLSSCDYILCEDTRNSKVLLDHLQIENRLVSFHKFSEKKEEEKVISDLKEGKEIALISDGGTPVINDPGFHLVNKCIENGIKVTAIPGSCSLIDAIALSGFDSSSFQFVGFLPKKPSQLKHTLTKIFHYDGLSVCFESPQRALSTLELIQNLDPNRKIALARELTKKFEEVIRGTAKELLDHFSKNPLKGEIVLLFEKNTTDFKDIEVEELLFILKEEYGLSSKEALKLGAKLLKEPKNLLYRQHIIKD